MNAKRLLSLKFFRFVLVGALNALAALSIIYGAKYFFQSGDVSANAMGYGVGVCVSYFLNSRWTFGYRGAVLPAMLKFVGAAALAYAANLMSVVALIDLFEVNGYVAQAIGMPVYTVVAFLASKYMVFR